MMTAIEHPLVVEYLTRLSQESSRLPADQAAELIADIRGHLGDALDEGATEVRVREVLDRLGTPGELVTAAGAPEFVPTPAPVGHGSAWREAGALVLLLAAIPMMVVLPVGLLMWVAGLVLTVIATRWTLQQKLLAGLGLSAGGPLVLVAGLTAYTRSASVDGSSSAGLTWVNIMTIAVLIGYVVFVIWAVVHLAKAARR